MDLKTPKVSIIVSTYNRMEYLAACLEAILQQTFTDFELIVVSDGSTDGTHTLLKKYARKDSRMKMIRLTKNTGLPAVVRNEGLKIANGQYIAFCDDDDIWQKEKLAIQIKAMDSQESDFSFTNVAYWNVEKNKPSVSFRNSFLRPLYGWLLSHGVHWILYFSNYICLSTVMVRREMVIKTGVFNEDPLLFGIEDYEYWLRLFAHPQKTSYINEITCNYRTHKGQIGGACDSFTYQRIGQMLRTVNYPAPFLRFLSIKWVALRAKWT